MADAGRCLSDLSDDLLRHILFLLPDRAGAATAVLSRRWRWLWRTSGIVYLDSRSFIGGCSSADEEREAFHRGAEEALAAAAALGPVRRLTFSISEYSKIRPLKQSWSQSEQKWIMEHNLMEALVSNPAARRVEELQIEFKPSNTRFMLSFGSLPSEALLALRIVGCNTLTAAPTPSATAASTTGFILQDTPQILTAFPMLVDLHLQDCSVSLIDLQSIIDASPRLSALHLASSYLFTETNQLQVGWILIPAVSALVLTNCKYQRKARLELDVPRLQHFRYEGSFKDITNHLSIKSSQVSANMVHVDLDLTDKSPTPTRESFWRFIQSFNTTKLLKLKMNYFNMNDLALTDKAKRDEVLGGLSFSLLEQLELEAQYIPGVTSMMMLANLLQCCPMVRDIRIKLTKRYESYWSQSSTDIEAGLHFNKSVSGFRNRRRRSMVSLDGQNDDNYEAFDIPGLTGEDAFRCLQSHLKRLSLQFFREQPNCLGVQLAKFFAQNAMVLQEMHIDDGCQEMLEHANFSVRRWIANTDIANNQLTLKD